jgi:hypothetical protein
MTITPTGTWKKPRMKVYDYNQVRDLVISHASKILPAFNYLYPLVIKKSMLYLQHLPP